MYFDCINTFKVLYHRILLRQGSYMLHRSIRYSRIYIRSAYETHPLWKFSNTAFPMSKVNTFWENNFSQHQAMHVKSGIGSWGCHMALLYTGCNYWLEYGMECWNGKWWMCTTIAELCTGSVQSNLSLLLCVSGFYLTTEFVWRSQNLEILALQLQ